MSTRYKITVFLTMFAVGFSSQGITQTLSQQAQTQSNNRNTEIQNQFIALDRNKDGQISRIESYRDVAIPGHFHRLDLNRDRVLDKAEFAGFELLVPRRRQPVTTPQGPAEGPIGQGSVGSTTGQGSAGSLTGTNDPYQSIIK